MDDPVSWLMIRPGWKVYAADGTQLGAVDEVAGDDKVDIFDGLAVAASALGHPKYVPAEKVTTITEGRVNLSLTHAEFESEDEFLEPPTSAEIEPESRGGMGEAVRAETRKLAGAAFEPIETRQRRFGLVRRIEFFFRRLLGR